MRPPRLNLLALACILCQILGSASARASWECEGSLCSGDAWACCCTAITARPGATGEGVSAGLNCCNGECDCTMVLSRAPRSSLTTRGLTVPRVDTALFEPAPAVPAREASSAGRLTSVPSIHRAPDTAGSPGRRAPPAPRPIVDSQPERP